MLELRILNGAQALPLFDLPAVLGRRRAAREVGDQIEALIAFMDELGGDPDLEDGGDMEPDGTDLGDQAWPEGVRQDRFGMTGMYGRYLEDAEEDDSDCCTAGDDVGSSETTGFAAGPRWLREAGRAGFRIGDDVDAEDGDDAEDDRSDLEAFTWPERIKQGAIMIGGLSIDHDEDEPRHCPELVGGSVRPAPANYENID